MISGGGGDLVCSVRYLTNSIHSFKIIAVLLLIYKKQISYKHKSGAS